MVEMIVFSICNKAFKPLVIHSGRVKSREGLPAMIPQRSYWHYVIDRQSLSLKYMVHTSLANLTSRTYKPYHLGPKHHFTHDWKIETTHAPKSTK